MAEELLNDTSGANASDTRFLHRAVAATLRNRIAHGQLLPGLKLPSLRDMAAEFKVSMVTVNKALELLEKENRVYRLQGVGVFAHPIGSNTTAVRRMLTLAVGHLPGAFDMGIARGVERACQEYGWGVQILSANLDSKIERRNLAQLFDCGTQGAIILPTGDPDNVEAMLRVNSAGLPMVLLDKYVPGLRADFVESDHEGGGFMATKYLLDRGHRHIRLLTTRFPVSSVAARKTGYARALQSMGMPFDEESVIWVTHDCDAHREAIRGKRQLPGYKASVPVLAQCPKPVAIFAVDCYLAWGAYVACQELGLRIPEDVSIIAFDDAEFADAIQPPMTIIKQRTDELGRVAVELLAERSSSTQTEDSPRLRFVHNIIGVDLVERESVADLTLGQS